MNCKNLNVAIFLLSLMPKVLKRLFIKLGQFILLIQDRLIMTRHKVFCLIMGVRKKTLKATNRVQIKLNLFHHLFQVMHRPRNKFGAAIVQMWLILILCRLRV